MVAAAAGMSDPYFRCFKKIQKKPRSSEHEIQNLPSEQCVQHNLILATASLSHSCSCSGIIGMFKNQCKYPAVVNLSRIIYYNLMPVLYELPSLKKRQKAVTDVLLNLASLKFPF